jgi:uncharacterized membrane protein YoaK (UPF0700 family)
MGYVDLMIALLFFILGNFVAYVVYNKLGINQIPPCLISIGIQVAIIVLLMPYTGVLPFVSEFIVAEIILIAVNRVLLYLTGKSI